MINYILGTLQPDTELAMVGYPFTDEVSHQFFALTVPTVNGEPNPCFAVTPIAIQRVGAVEQLRLQSGDTGTGAQRHSAQGAGDGDQLAVVTASDGGAARLLRLLPQFFGLQLLGGTGAALQHAAKAPGLPRAADVTTHVGRVPVPDQPYGVPHAPAGTAADLDLGAAVGVLKV